MQGNLRSEGGEYINLAEVEGTCPLVAKIGEKNCLWIPPSPQYSLLPSLSKSLQECWFSYLCDCTWTGWKNDIFKSPQKGGSCAPVQKNCCASTLRSIVVVRWGCLHLKCFWIGTTDYEARWNHVPNKYMTLEHRAEWNPCFTRIFERQPTLFSKCSQILWRKCWQITAILMLMNMLRLCGVSLHSCQDLRPRVTSAVQEEEEGKAANEQMLSIIFWMSCFGHRRSCLLAGRAALQSGAGRVTRAQVIFRP